MDILKIKWLQHIGEMGKSITCWRKILLGFHVPEIIKNLLIFDRVIFFKLKGCPFLRHGVGNDRRFRVTASYLLIVTNFNVPHLHLAPPLGVTPFEFCRDLWRLRKLEYLGYDEASFAWSYI